MKQEDKNYQTSPRNIPYSDKIQRGLVTSSNLPSTATNRELFRAKAVWYLDIFPDEIVVQEKTVSIIRRKFLYSYVETVPIKDIGEVVITLVFVFASLTIIEKFTNKDLEIKNLRKNDAYKAKNLIDGLLLKW